MAKKPVKRKIGEEDLQEIEAFNQDISATLRMAEAGKRQVKLFRITDSDGNKELLEILNNPERYVILSRDQTWEKDKGITLGMCIFLEYCDRFPDLKEALTKEKEVDIDFDIED